MTFPSQEEVPMMKPIIVSVFSAALLAAAPA
jgi:hypothetical protein